MVDRQLFEGFRHNPCHSDGDSPTGRLSPSGNRSAAKEIDNGINNACERVRLQRCQVVRDKVGARGEKLAGPGVAGDARRAGRKHRVVELDRSRVAVWLARHLTENLISATGVRERDGRPKLGLREAGE
jgi:hypothetical protein